MSWQAGDVSPDARRAAEAAAEAVGVPLEEWFAEAVRAAVIRELGQVPAEPESNAGARTRTAIEPDRPPVEPVVLLPTAKPGRLRIPESPVPAPIPPEPIATTPWLPPAEIAGPEPVAHEVIAAPPPASAPVVEPEPFIDVPPAPSEISEPEPLAPDPIATAEPPAPASAAAPEAHTADRLTHQVEPQRLTDRGFSTWLAARIQGLPTSVPSTLPSAATDARSIAAAPPSPPALPGLRLDPLPLARTPLPTPTTQLREPAPLLATPPARPISSTAPPVPPQPTAAQFALALPLSLPTGPVATVRLSSLRPARIRARRAMDADPAISALAASVASEGVLEPILVRRLAEKADQYEVVAGERRRLAAERAGRTDLPTVIVEADDAEALLLSLTENLGRRDFSPLDEARAYLRLLTEFRVSPTTLAQRLARERAHIALALRLLGLPATVRERIDGGQLVSAQAFSLLAAADPEAMAQQMIQATDGGATRDSA